MRKFSTSITLMFREYGILDRFGAARAAGFKGVEIQLLQEGEPKEMAKAAADAGVEVVLVNVGMGDFLKGGPGLSGVPGREQEFRTEVARALEAAQLLDARFVHLGPSRVPEEARREECLDVYRRNVEAAVAVARDSGRVLLIEPMNRVEGASALINDIDQAAELIRRDFAGRIGLQFDIYHVAMNGRDIGDTFAQHRDLVRHVQFADVPGRHEPGTGEIDFARVFTEMEASGYDGWVGAEYFPTRPTAETLGWLADFRATQP